MLRDELNCLHTGSTWRSRATGWACTRSRRRRAAPITGTRRAGTAAARRGTEPGHAAIRATDTTLASSTRATDGRTARVPPSATSRARNQQVQLSTAVAAGRGRRGGAKPPVTAAPPRKYF